MNNESGPFVRLAVHIGPLFWKNGPPPPHFFWEPLFSRKKQGCGFLKMDRWKNLKDKV
jgi:hypothetical protein